MAAVLELARQIVESHCRPKNTIIFATFDLEEMGGQVLISFRDLPDNFPYSGIEETENNTCFSEIYACPDSINFDIIESISGMWSVALGSKSGFCAPKASAS